MHTPTNQPGSASASFQSKLDLRKLISLAFISATLITASGCASIKESWTGHTSKSSAVSSEPMVVESAIIQFDLESAALNKDAKASIRTIANKAVDMAPSTLIVTGYTDVTGSEGYNQKLSLKRAMAVKKQLDSLTLQDVSVKATGDGETSPVADNASRTGRQKNRRAEITLLKP